MTRGHIRDMGIITHLLNIKDEDDFKAHPHFGRLWEAFVTEQIIKGISNTLSPFQYYYYRTKNQAEIDLVIEGKFGLIPIEIKAGIKNQAHQLFAIKQFMKDNKCPLGILINQADKIVRLSPQLLQIPVFYL